MHRLILVLGVFVAIAYLSFGQGNAPPKRYLITLELKQVHYTLSLWEHAKDAMNSATFSIPVDREFYDSVQVGDVLADQFRAGSFIVRGTFGKWKVSVVAKRELP